MREGKWANSVSCKHELAGRTAPRELLEYDWSMECGRTDKFLYGVHPADHLVFFHANTVKEMGSVGNPNASNVLGFRQIKFQLRESRAEAVLSFWLKFQTEENTFFCSNRSTPNFTHLFFSVLWIFLSFFPFFLSLSLPLFLLLDCLFIYFFLFFQNISFLFAHDAFRNHY